MKVLQINVVYQIGSTGKIVACIKEGLQENEIEAVVCYGRGKRVAGKNIYKVSSEFEAKIHAALAKLFGMEFAFSPIATQRIIRLIKKEKPDVVHLHCLNGHFVNVYQLIKFLKENKIRTVLTLHAEIMQTAGCEHALDCQKWRTECHDCKLINGKLSSCFRDDAKHCFRLMKTAFDGFKGIYIIGVSEWLTSLAKESPIFQNSDCVFGTVYNGIDTSVFHYSNDSSLFERYNIPKEKKIILHVTPNFNSSIKGGVYVLQLAKLLPNYTFVIVGYNGDYRNLPNNVICIAHTNDQKELACFYSLADCFICTSKSESLPTVCLEAAACGCPIVAFNVGGVCEAIPSERGFVIEYGNIDEFKVKIEQICNSGISNNRAEIARDYKEMVVDYIDVYNSLVFKGEEKQGD